jgi:hypothetical protein
MHFANALTQFQRLETEAIAPLLAAQSLATIQGQAVLFGLTPDKFLFLLPDVNSNLSADGDIALNSISLEKYVLDLEGLWTGSYLAVSAMRASFDLNLFAAICDEMVKGLASGKEPIELIAEVAQRWRDLLAVTAIDEASLSEILGMFGELLVLDALAVEIAPELALAAWVGVDKARHDFEFARKAFEVKTSRVLNRTVAQIHGLQQLATSPHTDLSLCHIQVEWSPDGSNLGDLVDGIRSKLPETLAADFEKKLSLAKFTEARLANSASHKFKLVRCALFLVDKDFPKLTRAELGLLGSLDTHLTSLNYGLSLDGLPFSEITQNLGGRLAEIIHKASL